jgi:predicted nucleic acid-binding Zn finger protein
MRKILIILFSLTLLSACAQSTALIGPAITIGNTGNVMQAGFSYGSDMAIKHTTGKSPAEHVTSYVKAKKEEKKIKKEITSYLATHIEIMRKKLSLKK